MTESKQEIVLDVVAQVTGTDRTNLRPEMDLAADLAVDSPKALELLVELENRLEIEITDEAAARMETVADILGHVG